MLAALGYGLAAWVGAALAWDGSWSLFRTLRDGQPFVAHGRWADAPFLWLVLRISQACPTLEPLALARLYGFLLVAIPLGSLAVCWRTLRGRRWEPLRVWPALGILLAPLPGQWCVMSEATLAAQLGWPLLALAAVGGETSWRDQRAAVVGLTILAAWTWGLHPGAAVPYALAGAAAWARHGPRRPWRGVAAGFGLLALARVVWTVVEATPYEREEVSLGRVLGQWRLAVWGWPLVMLVGVGGLAAVAFWQARGKATGFTVRRAAAAVFGLGTTLAGVVWASDPVRWGGALDYRRFVLPTQAPLYALAAWHWRRPLATDEGENQETPSSAGHFILVWTAGACAATLAVQAFVWRGLVCRFDDALAARATAVTDGRVFVTRAQLPFLHGTALDHWSATPLSLLLRSHGQVGEAAGAVWVMRPEEILNGGGAVQVTPWDVLALPPMSSSSPP